MRILMIAPQPFLEERGAPFAIYHHIKALLQMGFKVDLVTYHQGKTVELPGLRIFRIAKLPFIHQIRVGPSLAKIPLDLQLFLLAFWRLCITRYPYVHTHEEAGLMGIIFGSLFGCKHLYYMHSDLSQQLVSSEFIENPVLIRLARTVQAFMARESDAIIAICPDIEKTVKYMAPQTPVYMIENSAVDEGLPPPQSAEIERLRQELNLGDGPVLLYTGNLECYQGIELLLQSIPTVHTAFPGVRYMIVGGQPCQIEKLSELAQELGIIEAVRFVGQSPLAEMPLYMALADILVSPRTKGTNTPLKLYTYLHSGKPILATAIFSQAQVLTSEIAMLVDATAEGLAQGALALLLDPVEARALGTRGRQFASEHYSWPVFYQKTSDVQLAFADGVQPSLAVVG